MLKATNIPGIYLKISREKSLKNLPCKHSGHKHIMNTIWSFSHSIIKNVMIELAKYLEKNMRVMH